MITLRKLRSLKTGTLLRKLVRLVYEFEKRAAEASAYTVFDSQEKHFIISMIEIPLERVDNSVGHSSEITDKISESLRNQLQRGLISLKEKQTEGEISPKQWAWILSDLRYALMEETGEQAGDWDMRNPVTGAIEKKRRQVFPLQVCIDRIRSPFNVGSVFRTAESFGVEKIMLLQGSASPEHPRAKRSAMGCTEIIPWKFSDDAVRELTAEEFGSGRLVGHDQFKHDQFKHDQFKHDQFKLSQSPPESPSGSPPGSPIGSPPGSPIGSPPGSPLDIPPVFALELGGTPVDEFVFPDHGVVIIGSEELGVSPELLSLADEGLGRVSIPTCGNKGSLNVSVAFGILMQHWYSSLKAVRKPMYKL